MTTYSPEISPEILAMGDVRVACREPERLIGHLLISDIAPIEELRLSMPELCDAYQPGAWAPDPRTLRPCTEEEMATYVVALEHNPARQRDDPRVVMYVPAAHAELDSLRQNRARSFGLTDGDPGALTTTHDKERGGRPGMHVDSRIRHRAGVNYGPDERRLVVATHSARLLCAEAGVTPINTGSARHTLRTTRLPVKALHLELSAGDIYIAHTGSLIHDGSRITLHGSARVGFFPISV